MSAQLVELIFFAAIAFVIISKLISALGNIAEDDQAKKNRGKSFFGESGNSIRDVTNTTKEDVEAEAQNPAAASAKFSHLIIEENKANILKQLAEVENRLPNFNLNNFIRGAKGAFKMIMEAVSAGDNETLSALIDKRYMEKFTTISQTYGKFIGNDSLLDAGVSDVYMFGNNVFIKVIFTAANMTSKLPNINEEWTFTQNTLSSSADWHLSNIDKAV